MDQKTRDTELAVRFAEWYCKANHRAEERSPLDSPASEAGVYGNSPPLLCQTCSTFAVYVEKRTGLCPHDPKPFCAFCDIKCYRQDMAEYSRKVMRHSGPRSLLSRYWCRALQHIAGSLRYRFRNKRSNGG